MYVNGDGQFYCHKCGQDPDGLGKGNAITFARIMGASNLVGTYEPRKSEPEIFNSTKATRVYTWAFKAATLTDTHKDQLVARGLTDPDGMFNLRSSDGLADQLKQEFSAYELRASGLFYTKEHALIPHRTIYSNRVLIPYYVDGEVRYMRSRGMSDVDRTYIGPIGAHSNNYIWGKLNHRRPTDFIITEGEIKAMAAVQAGYHCASLPGMSSAHDTLATLLHERHIGEVTIMFDSQVKDMKYVDYAASSLSTKLKAVGIKTYRACLPLDSNIGDGKKMDIDAFLLYHTTDELDDIIYEAKEM